VRGDVPAAAEQLIEGDEVERDVVLALGEPVWSVKQILAAPAER